MPQRPFTKSDFPRRCSVCGKPTTQFRRNADGTILCPGCVRQDEVIPAPKPGLKRGARLQITA